MAASWRASSSVGQRGRGALRLRAGNDGQVGTAGAGLGRCPKRHRRRCILPHVALLAGAPGAPGALPPSRPDGPTELHPISAPEAQSRSGGGLPSFVAAHLRNQSMAADGGARARALARNSFSGDTSGVLRAAAPKSTKVGRNYPDLHLQGQVATKVGRKCPQVRRKRGSTAQRA